MHDKVLSFIRETLLHEYLFDCFLVNPAKDEVLIKRLQPNRDGANHYPDPVLILTCSSVSELGLKRSFPRSAIAELVLSVECSVDDGVYHATILIGNNSGVLLYRIALTFESLRYDCLPG